jgi:fatty acid desaturase
MRVEWPTLALIAASYLFLWVFLFVLAPINLSLAVLALIPLIALQSSLQHEVLHGHPFGIRPLDEGLVLASFNLFVPYLRFRDTHLAHHQDANLTDPYDDPESNYLDPAVWAVLPGWHRALLRANNTLLGRVMLGPIIGQIAFMLADWRAIRAGNRAVLWGWVAPIPVTAVLVALVIASPMPLWAYLLACYAGLGVLKIRTFLEHQAHERASGRTAIIEDRGPLAFLFLNNNLHVVHHMHPRLPWYSLPGLYRSNRDRYLTRNGGYAYASYADIARRHLWRSKDPVPHPHYRGADHQN